MEQFYSEKFGAGFFLLLKTIIYSKINGVEVNDCSFKGCGQDWLYY